MPDYSTPNKKKRYVEAECRNMHKKFGNINRQMATYFDGIYGVRRQKAILDALDRAEKEFQSFGLSSIVESFVRHELLPINNYNNLDMDCDLRLGAALWILEKLRVNGKLGEAYEIIPDVSGDPDNMVLPVDFSHPCYDEDLIQSVIYVISNRYGGPDNSVITEENAARKEPGETYRRLLALLPAEDVERACDDFRTRVWELITLFMKGQAYYDREATRYIREVEKIRNPLLAGPLANPVKDDGLPVNFSGNDMTRRGKDLLDQSKNFQIDFERYLRMDRKAIRRETGSRELAELLAGFSVQDPYALCFALFDLMDTGDDAVWLMRSGCILMDFAWKMMPWYVDQDEWDDEEWDAWYEGMPYNRNGWLEQEKPEEQIDYYHQMHGDQNLAQVIYGLCRTVVPTGLHPFEADRKRLIEEGMEENTARKITDQAELLFLYKFQASQRLTGSLSWMDDEEFEEDEDTDERPDEHTVMPKPGSYWGKVAASQGMELISDEPVDPDEEEDREKLKEELLAAKKQLKTLKTALAETRQEAGRERAKYEYELKNLRMEHRELADLRELVFNSELSEAERERREKPEQQYSYPYTTRKRTVVFGGHDSFLRAFKPMLPDVKYVDASNLTYSPEIIRNSDVVWIQNNCMSHSQYWSIVKTCKLAGVQMRYFGFASAEKCAEQLVTEDLK